MAYQRQNWQANESGILRKKDENEEELLVFGYSCKLFRDDEKALYVDQGKHLIPWMGDESLRIDRYDVRGALYDLSQYEAISGQQEELFWINLSSEERRIEQLCDEERYRALTHNEDEERLYQEEELKRLHQALGTDKTYGQVSYSYDDENGETEKPVSDNQTDDVDEPFVPPSELDLPQDIVLPETVKLNAIIEKTAMFINQQGSQMEIILKMKQASNPQFEFLSYLSPLHAYYRHVLGAIKSGRYKPKIHSTNDTEKKAEEENPPADHNYYLHHTLSQAPTSSVDVAPVIPSINYKPSADCAYSMLVNKIRNNQNKMVLLSKTSVVDVTNELPEETTVVKEDDKSSELTSSPKVYDPTESVDGNFEEDSETVLKPSSPQPLLPLQRTTRRKRRKRQQGGFAYNDAIDKDVIDSVDGTEFQEHYAEPETIDEKVEPESTGTLEETYEIPPTDLQLIIDKMACYVGKNGRDFEEIVKSKADPRFSFLDALNPYHLYYRKKVEFYELSQKPVESLVNVDNSNESNVNSNGRECEGDSIENGDSTKASHLANASSKLATAQKPNPVSFSIKRPKETENLEIKSALPIEESSDEENDDNEDGEGNTNDNTNAVETSAEQTVLENANTNVKNSTSSSANLNVKNSTGSNRHVSSVQEKRTEERTKEKPTTKDKEKITIKDKEKIATKDKEKLVTKDKEKITTKDKEKITTKDKEKLVTKDKEKLPNKDKEKLTTKDKEKQLQLERKKRAAAFLNLIQKTNKKPVTEDEEAPVMIGPQLPDELKANEKSESASENDEDSDSVSSPPSSVTSPDVTLIGEITVNQTASPKSKPLEEESSFHSKPKRSKYSMPEKYASRHIRDRNDVEYKHKHRKRKRSRTPTRKRSHSSRSRVHRTGKESKHRKHHRHHHKEWRHSDREYNSSAVVHRRHKHSKQKKHKRKESKKYNSNKSNSTDDSDSD